MYPCHVYAIKLEIAFRRGDCCPFSADAFESKFQETLERGLLRLSAENLIESSEMHGWKNTISAAKSCERLWRTTGIGRS